MKRLELFYGAAALAALLMAAPFSVDAQENGNRDEFGNIVRGPYETNMFGDNWFIGVGGGINMMLNEGYEAKIGPSLDINFGKWFTPSVGMRAGYQGLNFFSAKDGESDKYGYMYFHGDFLWNASNAIGGYKESRFWNLVPYVHGGFFRSDGVNAVDNEFAAGAGLLHNLMVTERLDIIIDMRATVVNGTVHGSSGAAVLPSITAGLAFDLGYPGFVRTASVLGAVEAANAEKALILETAIMALEAANTSLEAENNSLVNENRELEKTIEALEDTERHEAADYEEMQPITVYFEIGRSELDALELQHLDFYVSNIIEKADNDPDIEIIIMGSADSNTGTAARNRYLSEERGRYIFNLLTGKYGIDKERIRTSSEVAKSETRPEFDRAAIITFE